MDHGVGSAILMATQEERERECAVSLSSPLEARVVRSLKKPINEK